LIKFEVRGVRLLDYRLYPQHRTKLNHACPRQDH
jgi:hypothetical protein